MVKMTAFMSDILEIEKTTQKKFQAGDLIITDIPKIIAKSQQAMSLVANGSFPGGEEEKVMNVHLEDQNQTSKRQVINKYVTFARDWSAIRNDLIESFQNFYGEKMNVEQEDLLRSILQFLRSSSVETMIETGRALIKDYFGEKFIQPFALEVIDFFQDFPEYSSITDDTERVRFLARAQRGHISRLAAAILTVSPHSMTVERIVSHQNTFFDCRRTRTTLRGLNSKLTIALNGKGTAFFDPRSAVSRFLSKKRRREREPTEKYRNRDFVRQFFSSDPAIRHGTVSMGHLYFGSPGLKM